MFSNSKLGSRIAAWFELVIWHLNILTNFDLVQQNQQTIPLILHEIDD